MPMLKTRTIKTNDARAGREENRVRYILGASLGMTVVAQSAILLSA